ncbi:hypothetical protein EDC94DRAFT_587290 [Helicostylum pulchrum]|nr:hypothetical protein EDC94DRAFT_587290 [Helicostylum pulchrum]
MHLVKISKNSPSRNILKALVPVHPAHPVLTFLQPLLSVTMVNITREQVVCIEEIKLDICYRDDPTSPIILSARSIDQNPFKNKIYQGNDTVADIKTIEEKEYPRLKHAVHLIEVYLPSNTENNEMYESKNVLTREIFCQVLKITNLLDDKSVIGFAKWCSSKKIKLMQASPKRKMNEDGNKTTARGLYVLKEQFIARKSKNEKNENIRIRLLNQMAQKLEERSLVDMVFMSPNTNSNEPITNRDVSKNNEMMSQLKANGDTQDMLKYISNEEKIVIVTIDYAGLTTNCEDLQVFFRGQDGQDRLKKLGQGGQGRLKKLKKIEIKKKLENDDPVNIVSLMALSRYKLSQKSISEKTSEKLDQNMAKLAEEIEVEKKKD